MREYVTQGMKKRKKRQKSEKGQISEQVSAAGGEGRGEMTLQTD